LQPQTGYAGSPGDETPPEGPHRNVLVTHGIHRGHFPVGGMRVRDARRVLERLIHVDPGAIAVIGGNRVGDEDVIGEDVTLLSFIKPSSLKGQRT